MKLTWTIACVVFVLALGTTSYAQYTSTPTMTLAQNTPEKDAPPPQETVTTETTETTETDVDTDDAHWDIFGPIRLRSADPEDVGDIELKLGTEWGTASGGRHDRASLTTEIDYGIAPNHEIFWSLPIDFGFGGLDGNADQTFGWHWRLWKEDLCGLLPTFALRNSLRVPSGYQSSGVDWTFQGLFTKSIIPCKLRFHFNPYFALVNGDNLDSPRGTGRLGGALSSLTTGRFVRGFGIFDDEPSHRYFRWGMIPGLEYKLCDSVSLLGSYIYENSPYKGQRDQNSLELGVDWKINKCHQIGLVNRMTLDGDAVGENYAIGINYVYVINNAPHLGS